MSSTKEEEIATWLHDAYIKKLKSEASLKKQLKQAIGYPDFQSSIEEHLEETKLHAHLLKNCLNKYKDSSAVGLNKTKQRRDKHLESYGSDMAFVRDVYGSYVEEENSVPSYELIRQAAEDLEDRETVLVCDIVLRDEKKIKDWRLAVSVLTKET